MREIKAPIRTALIIINPIDIPLISVNKRSIDVCSEFKFTKIKRRRIEIRGFGSFCIRDRKSIRARNPKSGETIELPKRSIPYFRASKALKERVN